MAERQDIIKIGIITAFNQWQKVSNGEQSVNNFAGALYEASQTASNNLLRARGLESLKVSDKEYFDRIFAEHISSYSNAVDTDIGFVDEEPTSSLSIKPPKTSLEDTELVANPRADTLKQALRKDDTSLIDRSKAPTITQDDIDEIRELCKLEDHDRNWSRYHLYHSAPILVQKAKALVEDVPDDRLRDAYRELQSRYIGIIFKLEDIIRSAEGALSQQIEGYRKAIVFCQQTFVTVPMEKRREWNEGIIHDYGLLKVEKTPRDFKKHIDKCIRYCHKTLDGTIDPLRLLKKISVNPPTVSLLFAASSALIGLLSATAVILGFSERKTPADPEKIIEKPEKPAPIDSGTIIEEQENTQDPVIEPIEEIVQEREPQIIIQDQVIDLSDGDHKVEFCMNRVDGISVKLDGEELPPTDEIVIIDDDSRGGPHNEGRISYIGDALDINAAIEVKRVDNGNGLRRVNFDDDGNIFFHLSTDNHEMKVTIIGQRHENVGFDVVLYRHQSLGRRDTLREFEHGEMDNGSRAVIDLGTLDRWEYMFAENRAIALRKLAQENAILAGRANDEDRAIEYAERAAALSLESVTIYDDELLPLQRRTGLQARPIVRQKAAEIFSAAENFLGQKRGEKSSNEKMFYIPGIDDKAGYIFEDKARKPSDFAARVDKERELVGAGVDKTPSRW